MGAAGSTEPVAEGGHASKSSAKLCRTKQPKRQLQAEAYIRVQSSSPMARGAIVMPTSRLTRKNQLRGDPYTQQHRALTQTYVQRLPSKEQKVVRDRGLKNPPWC